jgi:hypothetical protein
MNKIQDINIRITVKINKIIITKFLTVKTKYNRLNIHNNNTTNKNIHKIHHNNNMTQILLYIVINNRFTVNHKFNNFYNHLHNNNNKINFNIKIIK